MARLERSSDGPVPYGPSRREHEHQRPESAGGSPTPPQAESGATDETQVWPLPPVPTEHHHDDAVPGWGTGLTGQPPVDAAPPADAVPPVDGGPQPPGFPETIGIAGQPPGTLYGPSVSPPPIAPPVGPPTAPPPPPPLVAPPVMAWAPPSDTAPVVGGQALQYGRTFDRVMAWWLDSFIVMLPVLLVSAVLGGGLAIAGTRTSGITLIAGVVGSGIHLLYFVTFWTGHSRATPGMRLMKLTIGDARTGAPLTVQQGLVRWLAIGGVFQIVDLVPPLAPLGGLLSFIWTLMLLASTATSPTKQGYHDRLADSMLVQPTGAKTPAMTCLILLIILGAVWFVGIIALVAIGAQVLQTQLP